VAFLNRSPTRHDRPRTLQPGYTNDRHMLQAARYFHVTGVNILKVIL
jgi:hypothetical protein